MKYLALTIGGTGAPSNYNIGVPGDIVHIANLNVQGIISFAIMLLLTVAILLAFFFVIFGGFKWLMSSGDKKQVEEAQKTLQYAIIGLVVVLLSFFIINFIGFLLRVPLIGH